MIGSADRFGFGKYRGRLVIEVARFDPQYIWWVENNMSVRFTPKVKRAARNAMDRKGEGHFYYAPRPNMFY